MDPWKILLWLWRSKHNNISQILYPVLLDPCQQKHCATFSKIWNFIVLFAMLCFVTCCCVLTFRATVDSVCWGFFCLFVFFVLFKGETDFKVSSGNIRVLPPSSLPILQNHHFKSLFSAGHEKQWQTIYWSSVWFFVVSDLEFTVHLWNRYVKWKFVCHLSRYTFCLFLAATRIVYFIYFIYKVQTSLYLLLRHLWPLHILTSTALLPFIWLHLDRGLQLQAPRQAQDVPLPGL